MIPLLDISIEYDMGYRSTWKTNEGMMRVFG